MTSTLLNASTFIYQISNSKSYTSDHSCFLSNEYSSRQREMKSKSEQTLIGCKVAVEPFCFVFALRVIAACKVSKNNNNNNKSEEEKEKFICKYTLDD